MTKNVVVVAEDDKVDKIEKILTDNLIHHLIVVGNRGSLGVVSKLDLLKARNSDKPTSLMMAKDIMTSDPLTLESEDTIGLAADIFLANRFHSLPVVDDGQLVGILTTHDLIKHAYK